jgi:predicted neuraminidase
MAIDALDRNIATFRAFGPEHPGVYKHPAAITELANGNLYIAYYGGAGEYDEGTAVYGSMRYPGSANGWTDPKIIADTPMRGDGNPVIWQAPDGILWLFYNTQYGPTWSEARVKGKISKDGGGTWSDSFMVAFEKGSMCRGKPIALKNGDYLLPMYDEKGSDREALDTSTASYFLRYSPKDNTWTPTNKIKSPTGNLQPQVVQITDKHLICFMRRGGGYGPDEKGFIQKSESHDGGYTWSNAVETDLKNPNSAVDVIRLKNGDIVLTYNPSDNDRTPLRVSISKDDGKTFRIHRDIAGGDNTFAYPYLIQTKDEKLHVIYTTNNRTTIMHVEFKIDAIMPRNSDD